MRRCTPIRQSEAIGLVIDADEPQSRTEEVTDLALSIRALCAEESAVWDRFVSGAPDGHLLQSWGWGEFKRAHGWQPVRLVVVRGGEIVAGAQVLLRVLAGLSIAYVPRGPVAADGRPEEYASLVRAIHGLARSRRCVFLKIEPNVPEGTDLEPFLRRYGFVRSKHTVQARATLHISLEGGEGGVLARMKSKTRYNVRLAERRGVSVRASRGEADLREFHALMRTTGKRDQFAVRSLDYYRDALRIFRERNQGELLLAEYDGRIIAGLVVFAYGCEGIYMYGASSNEHRREMPNYLLQWEAIRWCLARGCTRYDLWGIPETVVEGRDERDDLDEKNVRSGLWGVYRFKQGFGGDSVRYIGAFDYPYIRPLYLLWARLRRSKEL